MKRVNYIYLILITAIICLLTTCADLDTQPTDMSTANSYFSDQTEVEYALNAVYNTILHNSLYAGGDCLISMFDVADQMWTSYSDRPQAFNYVASATWPNNIWQALYAGVERANILLDNIDKPQLPDDTKNYIKGEAMFLRAFYYFLLVQNWGAVPLRTEPTSSVSDIYYERTSANEVYDFIYTEMKEAEGLVRPITDFTHAERVTQQAVQGILARVCLYMAGFPNNVNKTEEQIKTHYADALYWAEKVIDSGLHELNPDYAQVFINLIQNIYETKESIWEVGYYTDGASGVYGASIAGALGVNNGINQSLTEYGYSGPQYRIQPALFKAFENNDQYQDTRRDWAIGAYRFKSNSNPPEKEYWDVLYPNEAQLYQRYIGKFRREYELGDDKIKNNNGTNFPLLRYSDVLLMAAEAENAVNGPTAKAHGYLNEVRNRAQTSPVENITGKDEFLRIIQNERNLELTFEGQRKMDLIRWGIFIERMREVNDFNIQLGQSTANTKRPLENVSEKDYYLPIPVREISLNPKLIQNPGW